PVLPKDDIGSRVLDLVTDPGLREHFERRGRAVVLHREQPVEAILDGQWFSGVIDRLHVHEDGKRVEVLDFKMDAVESMESLVERYSGQMEVYRRVMSEVYPGAQVECRLLSTRLRKVIRVEPPR
ncbi:MAG: PD-(D/E)XK nuclease family protein, partial [Verrucomicrobiota bacterium]